MKFWSTLIVLSSSCLVGAFPALSARNLEGLTAEKIQDAIDTVKKYQSEKRLIVNTNKPIQVTGRYAFQAPSKYDQRGPCPGLNALANHGYIAHTGITSFAEVVTAINQGMSDRMLDDPIADDNKVYGMHMDLGLILGVMGTVWTGNPLSLSPGFSIGGPGADNLLGNVLGLVGTYTCTVHMPY
jgi:hypothetical protein